MDKKQKIAVCVGTLYTGPVGMEQYCRKKICGSCSWIKVE